MNLECHLILLNNEDKTAEVESCQYQSGRYTVRFANVTRSYLYGYNNVKWIRNPVTIDCSNLQITLPQGHILYDYHKILKFDSYFRIFFKNGSTRSYHQSEIIFDQNDRKTPQTDRLLNYYYKVAQVAGIQSEDGQSLLANQLNQMSFVSQESSLSAFLNQTHDLTQKISSEPEYYPFGHNTSQIAAVKTALCHKISIIEGPPGTGKTQTILNLVANIIIRGQTVAIVSNNNSATANVREKLAASGFDFIGANLGKADNKRQFIDSQKGSYPDLSSYELKRIPVQVFRSNIRQLERDALEALDLENILARLRRELDEIKTQSQYFKAYLAESSADSIELPPINARRSADMLRIVQELGDLPDPDAKLTFSQRINIRFNFKIPWKWLKGRSAQTINETLQNAYFLTKIREKESEIVAIESRMRAINFAERMAMLKNQSMSVFRHMVWQKYASQKSRQIFTEADLWVNSRQFLREYPVVYSTTHSLRSSLNPLNLYDYLIVDEASQVDLVTGVLALSCAKSAIIVGDRMQLPNVVPEAIKAKAYPLFDASFIPSGFEYTTNSLLSAVNTVLPKAPRVLLREHYRCHPKIIGFCNQKFYNNQLIILTPDHPDPDVMKAYKTVVGQHSRSRVNQRQIDEIKQNILPELCSHVALDDIGIISPYRDQTQALAQSVDYAELDVSTVHKFQGREKEAIIITTVDNEISEFTDNPNLLNVAISRAKRYLRVVVSEQNTHENSNLNDLLEYMKYQNFEQVEGTVYSIFDLLYKDHQAAREAYLKKNNRISEYDSENLMYTMIRSVLTKEKYLHLDVVAHVPLKMLIRDRRVLALEDLTYVMNSASHIDFLIYSKLSKLPVLAIEVDGFAFHKSGTKQAERDQRKDRILEKFGVPYLRFLTNGSREKELLEERLG